MKSLSQKTNNNSEVVFEIQKINKNIKDKIILNDVSFKLFSKSFHVILGYNGAGKSTLFNICTGNDKKYNGTILFKNKDIKLIKNKKSFLYFSTNLSYPLWWNVVEYLENFFYFFTNENISRIKIISKLKEYSLEDKLKSNPNNLSSGEKKKLPIILIELLKPELVFLDEPDSNLDIIARKFIYEKLKMLANEGSSIFISSHYNDEIKKYADQLIYIKKGKIINHDDFMQDSTIVSIKDNKITPRK